MYLSCPFKRVQLRGYAKQAIKHSNKLAPSVHKAARRAPQAAQHARPGNANKEFIAGPPGSGDFAKLSAVTKRDRIAHKNTIQKVENFESLRIVEPVRQAIKEKVLGHLHTIKPTAVQTLAVKALRKAKQPDDLSSYLIAAETGSGKTLSYLAPLMSHLKDQETDEAYWNKIKNAPVVRSVVLLPTLELVNQLREAIKKMEENTGIKCLAAGRGISSVKKITKRVDILVSTPQQFLNMFDPNRYEVKGALSHCKYAVVDEADTLMDESFSAETHKALSSLSNLKQLVFCSATIPRHFDKVMTKTYPNIQRIVTPGIHKVPRHIDFRVIEVFKPPFLNSKPLALKQALYAIHHDNTESGNLKRVVVFVNRSDTIEGIVNNLNEGGYPAVGVSGALYRTRRGEVLRDFIAEAKPLTEDNKVKVQVLVTTDLFARGIDMQNIRNVILYDLPYSSVDLLHRAGRTGRLGKRGRVMVFVDRKESRGWVKGLERVVRNGMPLA